jgi:hypothetical protein
MKTKIKKVYYCEFCKKKTMTINSMTLHEKHCTLNPNRECRLCKSLSLEKGECPICKFSHYRLTNTFPEVYDFKKELKNFWENVNKEEHEREMRSLMY